MGKSFKEKILQDRSKEDVIDSILSAQRVKKPAETEKTKKDYTIQVRKKETRNRRFQLLLTQSLYDRIEKEAKELDISVNELINTVLDDVIQK